MAFVMFTPSLSWPVFVLCLVATVIGLVGVLRDHPRGTGMGIALLLAGVAVVISDDICKAMPWLIECWCRWCL